MNIQFSMESPLWRFFEWLTDIFLTNLFFILTSIPIITMGASITAMNQVMFRKRERKLTDARSEYFSAFTENFKQSTIIWILYLVFMASIILNINANINLGSPNKMIFVMFGVLTTIVTITVLYALAMTARFDNNLIDTLYKSLIISVMGFPYTLTMVLILIVCVILTLQTLVTIFIAFAFWLIIGFGLIGYVCAMLFLRAFRKVTWKHDLPEDSAEEEMYRAMDEDKKMRAYQKEKRKKNKTLSKK